MCANLNDTRRWALVASVALLLAWSLAGCNGDDISSLPEAQGGAQPPPPGTPGIVVTPTAGLVTDEFGAADSFRVVLNSVPASPVTIGLTSSDTGEGTIGPTSLSFDGSNWNVPQAVTVTGANDQAVDGDVAYTIVTAPATSGDPAYGGLDAADVGVVNQDNDVAINASARGWWRMDGTANPGAGDTFTGFDVGLIQDYNSYLVFDLSGVSGTFASVQLSLEIVAYFGGDSSSITELFNFWDVTTPAATVVGPSGTPGVYGDLETGISFGQMILPSAAVGTVQGVGLNANATAAVNAAVGTLFVVGIDHASFNGSAFFDEGAQFSLGNEPRTLRLVLRR